MVLDGGRVLLDGEAEELRRRAVTVSGPVEAVERFVAGYAQLHRETLGGRLRVTVSGAPDRPAPVGLELEPVSLQQLVVRTTQSIRPSALVGESR